MLRVALGDVPPTIRESRLIAVLVPAVNVLDGTAGIGQDVELRLRVLVDALALRRS